jgi:phosphoribosylamine--glycine ligase
MKILVVGSGGREHAVVKQIKKSGGDHRIFAAPGNAGIACEAECVDITATDIDKMVEYAVQNSIDFVVVTPDDPLVMGMVDAMNQAGIECFGPNKAAAAIEGSKIFAKELMKKYHIPTAAYESFDDCQKALDCIKNTERFPLVIKADGLALGKGVVIAHTPDQAREAVCAMMRDGKFGQSGRRIVIEEFLEGVELSVLTLTDGDAVLALASSMDHKRAFEHDMGPNTGGMGAIAPHPMYTPQIARRCMKEIIRPTVDAMNAEGRSFRGCLYFGLMLTGDGPKVIEYNCRLGDPEAQVVLPLLKGDFVELMRATANGTLSEQPAGVVPDMSAACVIMASGGYPGDYRKGHAIKGLDSSGRRAGVEIFHAATALSDGSFVTAGGRVLGIGATAPTLGAALGVCYDAAAQISFEGCFYRRDIGKMFSSN